MTLKCHLGASGLRFSEHRKPTPPPPRLVLRFTWISWVRPFGSGSQAPLWRWPSLLVLVVAQARYTEVGDWQKIRTAARFHRLAKPVCPFQSLVHITRRRGL